MATDRPRLELGYWLSSEERSPAQLVADAAAAEAAGFGAAMISDHFHPWVRSQGQSPFVWGVLGGIAEATRHLRVGTGVVAPVLRIHPAVVAHAAATAAVMLPGRFFLGLGSGERLNEHVTGGRWPGAIERRAMLEEAVGVIRALFEGTNVNHRGEHFRVENARLFTRPEVAPPVYLAAGGPRSAELAGRVADGMIGVVPEHRTVEAFEAAGGRGKPRLGQVHVCWAEDEAEARRTAARYWPQAALAGAALSDLARPEDFEQALSALSEEAVEDAVAEAVVCGPDPDRHVAAIARFAAAGFTEVYVHQVGPDQEGFLAFFEKQVRPRFESPS
jgi:coenzyme F420-dependent glucose-6-phosphate dehydrogenase